MKGRIIADWSKVDFTNPQHNKNVIGALNHFLAGPDRPTVKAALHHFSHKGNFPAEVLPLLEKLLLVNPVDTGYELIFDIRDFTSTRAEGFRLALTGSGLVFNEVKPGEKAKVYQTSGTDTFLRFALYGAALNWSRTLIEDGSYWELEDNTIIFRSQYYAKRAETFYALIEAIPSGQNVAWQAPTPAALATSDARYVMSRDANTINAAALGVVQSMAQYGVGPTTTLRLLAPLALKARINQALAFGEPMASGKRVVDWNIEPVFTQQLASQSNYYVCVPGLSAKGGYRKDLGIESDTDILAYADVMAGWGRWVGGIGNVNQFRRCASAS